MKRTCLLVVAALAVLAVATGSAAIAATIDHHIVQFIEDGAPGDRVPGAHAKMIRNEDGLGLIINTRHFPPGPMTVWLFFFTCDPADPACGPTGGGPVFGTSDVVKANGRVHLAIGVPEGNGYLTDAWTDEVHAVMLSKEFDPDLIHTQLTTPVGGTPTQVVIAIP